MCVQYTRRRSGRELVPGIVRMAAVYNMGNPTFALRWKEIELAAPALGIECQLLDVRKADDIGRAFTAATAHKAGALLMTIDGLMAANQRTILATFRRKISGSKRLDFVTGRPGNCKS